MKVRLKDVPVGSCYLQGRGKEIKKKLSDGRAVVVGLNGKEKYRKLKGDPQVDLMPACPVDYLGVGLRKHPEQVVEIGDGNILKRRRL